MLSLLSDSQELFVFMLFVNLLSISGFEQGLKNITIYYESVSFSSFHNQSNLTEYKGNR